MSGIRRVIKLACLFHAPPTVQAGAA
jgi:hypothetical protein